MKNLKFRLGNLFILGLLFTIACTNEDENPDGISMELLLKTWKVNESSIKLGGIPISNLYDIAGVPVNQRSVWSQFRLIFNANGTYEVQNVDLEGVESSGTW